MPFVKLDVGILDSTLWVLRPDREIFITALLMAEPREFTAPQAALEVGALKETGFIIPPGWYGFVAASGPGIVSRAHVNPMEGMAALNQLGQPEPESRTADFEGRRMVRVSGGYVILNFMKYRDKDHSGAERAKRYRERKKLLSVTRDVTPPLRDVTQSDVRGQSAEALGSRSAALPPGELPLGNHPPPAPDIPYTEIVAQFHEICTALPRVMKLTEVRRRAVKARWLDAGPEPMRWFTTLFTKAHASDFLCGRSSSWSGGFDWLMNPTNAQKVIEGNYENKANGFVPGVGKPSAYA